MRFLALLALLVGCAAQAPSGKAETPSTSGAPAERSGYPAVSAGVSATTSSVRSAPASRPQAWGTVTLDVVDMPLSQVIDRIADAADRPIVASVSSATTVTLSLHEARWHDALDYLIATYHLQARLAGRILVIEEPPHVALEAQGASTASWLLLLARQGGLSIVLPGNLPGTVDAELHDVRFEDALRATARDQGLEVEPVR